MVVLVNGRRKLVVDGQYAAQMGRLGGGFHILQSEIRPPIYFHHHTTHFILESRHHQQHSTGKHFLILLRTILWSWASN